MAAEKVDEAIHAFYKAESALFQANESRIKKLLFFLQEHYSDTDLRSAVAKGLNVDNKNVREHAEKLFKILNETPPGKS